MVGRRGCGGGNDGQEAQRPTLSHPKLCVVGEGSAWASVLGPNTL